MPGADPALHQGEDLALGGGRTAGGERAVDAVRRHLEQEAVPLQLGERRIDLRQRLPPAAVRERIPAEVVRREQRAALRQMLDRPAGHLERRRGRRGGRTAPPHRARVALPDTSVRPLLPDRRECRPVGLGLPPARREHRLLGVRGRVLEAAVLQPLQQVAAAGREALQQRLRVARDLEPRHRPHQGRHRRVADRLHPAPQLRPVVRAQQLLGPECRREFRAPPFAGRVPGHVGDHAVGVDLRVQIAVGGVTERRGQQPVGRYPRPPPGGAVVPPGLEELALEEVEGRAHRGVVRVAQPCPGMRGGVQRCLERERLGRREGDVDAREVLVLTVAQPAEPDVGPGHVSFEHGREGARRDRAVVQAAVLRALAVPPAGLAVLGIAGRVVPVRLEVLDGRGGDPEALDGGDHGRSPPASCFPPGVCPALRVAGTCCGPRRRHRALMRPMRRCARGSAYGGGRRQPRIHQCPPKGWSDHVGGAGGLAVQSRSSVGVTGGRRQGEGRRSVTPRRRH